MTRTWMVLGLAFVTAVTGCAGTRSAGRGAENPADPAARLVAWHAGASALRTDAFDRVVSYGEVGGAHPSNHPDATAVPNLHQSHDAGDAPASAPGVYVCPMHADVTDDKPSKCPKCGMILVRKEGKP